MGALLLLAVLMALPWASTAVASSGVNPPVVTKGSALNVTKTTAELTATVDATGPMPVTKCKVEYGISPGSSEASVPCSSLPGTGGGPVSVSATATGLNPDTNYSFKIVATTEEGTGEGEPESFTTIANAPAVTTGKAGEIKLTSALLEGTVNPEGVTATCEFKWGTSRGSLTESAPCSSQPGSGTGAEPVTAELTGLSPETTYYFKLVAHGEGGNDEGSEEEFETSADNLAVTTGEASAKTKTSAMLNGTVNPEGAPVTKCQFEYGTTKGSLNKTILCSSLPGAGTTPEAVSAEVSGLAPNTTYYFKLVAENEAGASPQPGAEVAFTTSRNPPALTTGEATAVTQTTATLPGTVNPEGEEVTACAVEYGATPSLGSSAACASLPPVGENPIEVAVQVTGLSPGTTYYYRLLAKSPGGEEVSTVATFTTLADKLTVTTGEASDKAKSSATLNGTVNPGGVLVTHCQFEYGTTKGSLNETIACSPVPGAGISPEGVSADVTGLKSNTTYYFKLVAENEAGASPLPAAEASFTTSRNPPAVATGEASAVTQTSATLAGTVNPKGEEVTGCAVEYGPTPSLGSSAACASLPPVGETPVEVAVQVTGLSPGTTYYYRVVAKSAGGEEVGSVATFTTLPATQPPPPPPPPPSGPGAPKGPEPARPPVISSLSESNPVFRVGRSSTAPAGRISRVSPTGTVFSFVLDQPAVVTVAFIREEGGHRIGKSCVVGARGAGKPACVRSYVAMMLGRRARNGPNRVLFTGRVRGRALHPGAYRATFTGESLAGSSTPSAISFRVVAH